MSPTPTSTSSSINKEATLQKYRGTLSLLGPTIDDLALSSLRQAQDSNSNPNFSIPHQRRNDRDREQPPYHITFLTKDELRSLSPENQKRVDALLRSPSSSSSELFNANLDTNNIFSLGVGSFSAVYWTVVIWASGQKLRKLLSLPPKHFHITLSSGPDIHNPPLGKGVDSLITPLEFSFLSLDMKTPPKIYDDLPTTHLDHLTFTLHLFHSHSLSQQCATALILRDEAEAAGGYKGFLRYADACWALRKYKLAMLAYGRVWERVAFLRIQKRKEKKMKMRELELGGSSTDNNDVVVKDDEEVKAHTKIQTYALKKLSECARYTEWGHVFRSDEVEDILSPHPLLHDGVRAALMRVWGEELRSAIRVLVDKRGPGAAGEENMGNENNPRTALFIPVFTSSTYQDQNHKQEEKKQQKRKFEFYRLPRFFSWVVPFHLALMSTPKSHADVRALASSALRIRRVVTLTEEERLPGTWFVFRKGGGGERERDIVNTFIPVKNECPPSIEQMDCVVRYFMQDVDEDEEEEQIDDDYEYEDGDEEEEGQDGWHYYLNRHERRKNKRRKKKRRNTPMLIHCGGGKGRAGTVAACYLVSFGFGPPHPHSTSTSSREERETQNTTSPKMSSQAAITALRTLRPGSLETSIQERFVGEWASTIWKRRSVFPPEGEEEPVPLVGVGGGAFGLNVNVEVEGSLCDFTTEGPVFIILVGLPGAGKSWFAKALMARDPTGWVYVSQDEIGSREVCERVVARGPLLPRRVNISGVPSHDQTSPSTPPGTSAVTRNTSRNTSRSRPRGLILDRCNPTSTDRKAWISLAKTWTDKVLYVHFDYPPELCVSRAQRRVEHPTLQPGGRVRAAVKAVGDVFEVPGVGGVGGGGKGGGKEKGVRAIVRVRSFVGAREAVVLVDGLGRRAGGGVVMKFPRTPHLMDLGGAGGDDVWVEGGVDGFMRGASPRVLGPSSRSASASAAASVDMTRESRIIETGVDQVREIEMEEEDEEQAEDKTLSPGVVSQPPITSTTTSTSTSMQQTQRTQTRRRKTVITEKLDGANMGLSLSPDGGTILVQNRSHYITSNSHAQFKKLDAWLARCGEGVRRVLLWSDVDADVDAEGCQWFPDRWILYGEWLAARHSVGYDNLEDWFVAFDLYDRVGGARRKGGFVDGDTMRRRCGVGGIVCAPVLFDSAGQGGGDGDVSREEELVKMVQERSVCGEERREGVVVKIEEWGGEGEEVGWVKARGKIVRGDFIPGNEHWTKGQLVFNKLREEY